MKVAAASAERSGIAARLDKLGIRSSLDLALHLPLRYEDETRLTRLRLEAGDDLHRRRVERDLAGEVHGVAGAHRLGVRADGGRGFGCGDRFHRGFLSTRVRGPAARQMALQRFRVSS